MYRCIERMVPHPRTQDDEIHCKLLHFNDSMGSFGLSMAIRGRSKDPPSKKFQSFQIILSIVKNELNFQIHLLKLVCIQLLLQPIGGGSLVGPTLI